MWTDKIAAFIDGKEFISEEKSEEEIKRYTLDEDLEELARVKKILKSGDDIQKSAIYSNIHGFYKWEHADSAVIFDLLLRETLKQEPNTLIEAAKGLKKILSPQESLKQINDAMRDNLFEITMNVMKMKNTSIIDEWIGVFEALLRQGNIQKYDKTIIDEFFKLSCITSPSINKSTSLRIIGILLDVKQGKVNDGMVEMAELLSQTAEVEIKQRFLNYVIEPIFKYLSPETHEKIWNEKLLDILQDSSSVIKCDCIVVIAKILPMLSESFKINKLKILFFDLLTSKQTQVKFTFSKYIGPFIYNLKNALDQKPANQTAVLATVQEYCESTESNLRLHFLYNFPGLLEIYGKKLWTSCGKQYYNMLLRDEVIDVRVQAAQVYFKVIEFVGRQDTRNIIRQHVRTIFLDEASGPKNALIKVLPQVLGLFASSEIKISRSFFSELLKEFVDAIEAQVASANWRFMVNLISIVSDHFLLFDSYELSEVFAPSLFQTLMKAGTQVRKQSLTSLIKLLDYLENNYKNERDTILTYISNNFYVARSYNQKDVLLDLTESLLQSDQTFVLNKEFKLINTLGYSLDRVSQIKTHLAKLIAPIYFVTNATDKLLHNKILEATKNLLSDKDEEVVSLTLKYQDEIALVDSSFPEKVQSYVPPGHSEYKQYQLKHEEYESDYLLRKPSDKNKKGPMQRKSLIPPTSSPSLITSTGLKNSPLLTSQKKCLSPYLSPLTKKSDSIKPLPTSTFQKSPVPSSTKLAAQIPGGGNGSQTKSVQNGQSSISNNSNKTNSVSLSIPQSKQLSAKK